MTKGLKGLLFLMTMLFATSSLANHVLGGNISYECLGGNTFGVTLTFYKDCAGATTEPLFELVDFIPDDPSCTQFTTAFDLVSATDVSDLCPTELANNSCNGGVIPGVFEVVYYGEVTLDPSCVWTGAWETGDWNYFINIDNTGIPIAHLFTTIDPSIPCEDSPVVTTAIPAPYACIGEDITHTITIDNPNNYDLVYSFTEGLTTTGAALPYAGGYTFDEPIPGITLDPATGEMTFTAPNNFGNYLIGVQIEMYDGMGNLVSTFYEYMTVVVRVCGSLTEFTTPPILNPHPDMTIQSDTIVDLCVGDSLCFDVEATNTNFLRSVTISSNYLSTVFSSATFTPVDGNPAEANFCVLVDESMYGTHTLTFDAIDDACEFNSTDEISLTINVSPTVVLPFTDTLVCANTELVLEALGDSDFSWNAIPIELDPGFVQGAATQTFTVTEPLQVEVISNNAELFCPNTAMYNIDVSLYDLDSLITNESCAENDGFIDITPIGGTGNYEYDWDVPASTEDVTGLDGGTYNVTITDLDAPDLCEITASFNIENIVLPTGLISGDTTLCEGACHDIIFEFTGVGPFEVELMNMTTGLLEATGSLSNGDSFQVCPTETTTYELQLVIDSNDPSCSYAVVSSVTVNVLPTVNATFEEPDDICEGELASLIFDIDQPGVFDVYTSIGQFAASDGDQILDVDVPNDPTIFTLDSIAYTGLFTCTNTTQSQVDIDVSPTVIMPWTDTLVCANTELVLDVTGDTGFTWNAIPIETDPGFIQDVTSQTFTVTEPLQVEVISVDAEAFCTATGMFNIDVSLYEMDTVIVQESCAQDDGSIDITPIGGTGNFFYEWDTPSNDEDLTGLSDGFYTVTVVDLDSPGLCTITETYEIVDMVLPTGSIADDVTICEGECYDITFELTGVAPFEVELVNTTSGVVEAVGTVSDGDTFEVCPAETSIYQLQLVTDSNDPSCIYDITSEITVTVLPTVNAVFEEPDDVCPGDSTVLVFDIDQPGFFNVYTSVGDYLVADGDQISDVLVPDNPTLYSLDSISYTGAVTCTNTNQSIVDIAQFDAPTAILSGDTAICFGDITATFDLEVTGVGPWLVDFDVIGESTASEVDFEVDSASFDFPIGLTSGPTFQEYCITSITDTGTGCTADVNSCATVVVEVLPDLIWELEDSYAICPGEEVGPLFNEIIPTIDPNGDPYAFDINIEMSSIEGVSDTTLSDVNFFLLTLSPEVTTTYTVLNIVDSTGISFCGTDINESFEIIVYDIPTTITPLDTLCDPAGEEYTVIFEIAGGDPLLYNVEGQFYDNLGLGNLVDNVYTSGPIPSGFGESWTVEDGDPCTPASLTMSAYECPTVTYAGTIDTLLTVNGLCENGIYCIENNGDEVLDVNDVLSFAIVDNENFALANVLSLQNINCWDITADIGFGPLEYGVSYYGVVIAGNDDGNGLVDITNANISVSEPSEIIFYEIPTATITGGAIVCEGDTATVQVQVTGYQPVTYDILLEGVLDSTVTDQIDEIFFYDVVQGENYTLANLSNEFCVGTTDGTGIVLVNPIPTITLSGDASICDNETTDLQMDLTGTPDWAITLTYEDADGDTEDVLIDPLVDATPFLYAVEEPGQYYVTSVVDGNNCSNADTSEVVSITVFDLPTLAVDFADTNFCAGTALDLELIASGQTDFTLTYDFNGDPAQTVTSTTDTIAFDAAVDGQLNLLQLEDGNGCITTLADVINIEELATPTADAGPDLLVCSNVDALIGQPFDAQFDYTWVGDIAIINDDTLAQPTVNAENTNEGVDDIYNLTLIMSNGQCEDMDDIQVTIEWEPMVDAGGEIELCNGDIVQLNGVGGVSCEWAADASILDPLDICNPNAQPADTTTYYLTVTGANNCLNTDSVIVYVPEPLAFEVEFDEEVCFATCDGDIAVTPSGSFGGYSIAWADINLTDFTESDLCAGVYDFTVTDAADCSIDGSVEIIEAIEYVLDDVILTSPTCFESDNGIIQVVSGTAVEYFIDVPDTNATGIFNDLTIGTYLVGAFDDVGCLATQIVDLTSLSAEIDFSTSITEVTVCYEEEVDITGVALGGDDNFTYSWYDCEPTPLCLIETAETTTVIPQDTLQIWGVATDGNGCSSDTLMVTINLALALGYDGDIANDVEICQGECIQLGGTAFGGNGDAVVTWVVEFPFEELGTDPSYEMCPMEDVVYIAVVDDGCSEPFEYEVDVTVFETAVVDIFIDGEDGCYPVTVEFVNLTDPELLYECYWNFGDGNSQPICTDIEYTYAYPGIYNPSLTVTTENGCTSVGVLEEPINVYDYPVVDFSWTPDSVSTVSNEVQFLNETINGQFYTWNFGGLEESTDVNPVFTFPLIDEASYDICLEAESSQGCISELCQELFVHGVVLVYVPNSFTPDFDGVNDVFKPVVRGVNPDHYSFKIFDRWDNIIFETTDINGYWNGNNRGGDHFVDHDVYVYKIVVRTLDTDEEFEYVGHVSIIR